MSDEINLQREKMDAELKIILAGGGEPAARIEEGSPEAVIEAKATEDAPESEIVQKARALGWKPQGDYEGSHFVTPEEYVNRAPLFERIDRQNKQINELKDMMKETSSHLSTVRKEAYEKAIKDLEAAKLQSVETGDVAGYKNIDMQSAAIREQMQKDPIVTGTPRQEVPSEVTDFMSRNSSWYNENNKENAKMKAAAEAVDLFLSKQASIEGTKVNPKDHLAAIEAEVKRVFPHRFENSARTAPASVGKSTSTPSASSSSGLSSRLSAGQRELGIKMNRSNPEYTLEMYAKDLESMNRLGK